MEPSLKPLILRGAHIIDPSQNLDGVADIHIAEGVVKAIGTLPCIPGVEELDLSGRYLSPGWIDLHVHAYGTLGFANPDAIGIYQGVTTFVDAGGAGIGVMDEFEATMAGLRTTLYAGPFVRPLGLIGLNFLEGEIRSLGNIPISRWVDFMRERPGMVRYLKCNAMGNYGPGSLKISKGLAEVLGVPLYMHIGEFQQHAPDKILAYEAFRIAEPGDMITHIYHGNLGKIVDDRGQLLPIVREAQDRGVVFDVGFGGFNFSWNVAERAFAQGLVPDTISSDLQQFNVVSPVRSLANVMSMMMSLGLGIQAVVDRVTRKPAAALALKDAGSLKAGMPADITIFDVVSAPEDLPDCQMRTRKVTRHFRPVMAFKGGHRFDCDMELAKEESNWLVQFSEAEVPARAKGLSGTQFSFLAALAENLEDIQWSISENEEFDYDKALLLQETFHATHRAYQGLDLRAALNAVYFPFIESTFSIQIGLFLMCIDRETFFSRVQSIASRQTMKADHVA